MPVVIPPRSPASVADPIGTPSHNILHRSDCCLLCQWSKFCHTVVRHCYRKNIDDLGLKIHHFYRKLLTVDYRQGEKTLVRITACKNVKKFLTEVFTDL